MTRHDVREMIEQHMFLSMVSSASAEKSETLKRIMARCPEVGKYDVTVTVNGVELDFMDYVRNIKAQLDRMVVEEAGLLIEEMLGSGLRESLYGLDRQVKDLSTNIRNVSAKLLGVDPREVWHDE